MDGCARAAAVPVDGGVRLLAEGRNRRRHLFRKPSLGITGIGAVHVIPVYGRIPFPPLKSNGVLHRDGDQRTGELAQIQLLHYLPDDLHAGDGITMRNRRQQKSGAAFCAMQHMERNIQQKAVCQGCNRKTPGCMFLRACCYAANRNV